MLVLPHLGDQPLECDAIAQFQVDRLSARIAKSVDRVIAHF
jgi:hypothetical protein